MPSAPLPLKPSTRGGGNPAPAASLPLTMQKVLVKGYWYTVTTKSTCSVTDAAGNPLGTATAGSQLSFQATSDLITFSDPAAEVLCVPSPGIIRYREGDLQGYTARSAVALGSDAAAGVAKATAIGARSMCSADQCVALGYAAHASGLDYEGAVAVGAFSSASDSGVAIGGRAAVYNGSVGIGEYACALSKYCVAIGSNAVAGESSIAIGAMAGASASRGDFPSVAIGYGAYSGEGSIVLSSLEGCDARTGSVALCWVKVDRNRAVQAVGNLIFYLPGLVSTLPNGGVRMIIVSGDGGETMMTREASWEELLPRDLLATPATMSMDDGEDPMAELREDLARMRSYIGKNYAQIQEENAARRQAAKAASSDIQH